MEINNVTNLIGNKRYKLAKDTNTNIQLQLEEKTKPLTEYDIIDIVNLQQVFDDERNKSKKYRFSGKLNIYTTNSLSSGATSTNWDPLFYGNPPVAPNNWVMQITYPYNSDSNYLINARTPSGTISSNAYRGLQYETLNTTTINNNDYLTLTGVQTHNLNEGDYIYLYSSINYNSLQGIHKVRNTGIDDDNLKKDLTLDTIIDASSTTPFGFGNFVRMVDASFDDINFNNSATFFLATSTDISGSTVGSFSFGETIYTTITTTSPHNLLTNDFVDIRTGNSNLLNGVWRVYNVIGSSGSTKFIIKTALSTTKGTNFTYPIPFPKWRRLDATPSEYYIRNFEVISSNIYETYPCAFSTNTYSDVSDVRLGTANGTWLFQFNQDINIERLRDNRGATLSQVYYTTTKRAGKNPYDWTHVNADWDFNHTTTDTSNGLEYISLNNPTGIGSIEKSSGRTETIDVNGDIQATLGSRYIGDFVEFNSKELQEKTVSDIIHRFGVSTDPNGNGYYYKPFKRLDIRKYSSVIETAGPTEVIIDIPENYVTYADGSIAWKDLLTIGYFEEGKNGVDYPFLNGAHYFYFSNNLYVRTQIPNPASVINQSGIRSAINLTQEC